MQPSEDWVLQPTGCPDSRTSEKRLFGKRTSPHRGTTPKETPSLPGPLQDGDVCNGSRDGMRIAYLFGGSGFPKGTLRRHVKQERGQLREYEALSRKDRASLTSGLTVTGHRHHRNW